MRNVTRLICLTLASFAFLVTAGNATASSPEYHRAVRHHHAAAVSAVQPTRHATTSSALSSRRLAKPYAATPLTVNTTTDAAAASPSTSPNTSGGQVSLRSAIQYLDGGASVDTIYVPAGTFKLTVTGAGENNAVTGDLDVNASVVIVGQGANSTFVVGDGDRVFDINPVNNSGVSVTIADMTVEGGTTVPAASSENGGGINVTDATVTLDTVDVNSNVADGNGGGINMSSGTLVMNGGTLDTNKTNNTTGGGNTIGPGNGGGANFDGGTATFNNVDIMCNFAYSQGGGVHSSSSGVHVTVNNCTVYKDSSSTAWGGAFSMDAGNLTVSGGTIRANSAPLDGGAIDNAGAGAISISNALVDSNTSSTGAAIGVLVNGAATTTITGSTLRENFTSTYGVDYSFNGGAMYTQSPLTINNSSIDSNRAGIGGGAIYLESGTDSLVSVKLVGNTAGNNSGTVTSADSLNKNGGAIFNHSSQVYFSNVTIENNTALSGRGGGVYDSTGGIYWDSGSLSNNSADTSGGGLFFLGTQKNDTLKYVAISGNSPNDIDTSSAATNHVILIDMSLAVQATDFVATTEGNTVNLSWDTQSEDANAGFNILRKDAGQKSFELIASYTSDDSLHGLGTSSTGQNYHFTDSHVIPGETYTYMIESVSTKGTTRDLTTLSVTVNAPTTYALYQNFPNPFNPSTTIRFDLKQQSTVSLEIYNVLGQSVRKYEYGQLSAGEYNKTLDMSDFASGVYFYRIIAQGANGQRFSSIKKLVLEK